MRRIFTVLLPPLLALLLTGCVRDTATYYVDPSSNDHTLSLRRQQQYFWNDNVDVILVATRMPDCMRQIPLGEMLVDEVDIEVFAAPENHWSLRAGPQVWQVQTQSCALIGDSGPVVGNKVGAFKVDAANKLVFEAVVAAQGQGPAAGAAGAQ